MAHSLPGRDGRSQSVHVRRGGVPPASRGCGMTACSWYESVVPLRRDVTWVSSTGPCLEAGHQPGESPDHAVLLENTAPRSGCSHRRSHRSGPTGLYRQTTQ